MLLKDQQLVPRLRSLKRFFFLSQSFFVTHLLDLAQGELRKPAKSSSIVKLQSLLELALNTDLHGEDSMFREDVKVTMASSGLYEWLLKIISVNGVIGGEEGEGIDAGHAQEDGKKGKEDKKQILGEFFS
jgi:gamma-tubulin complex component 2